MRIIAILIFLLSLSGAASATDAPNSLVLKTGGSIFSSAFSVKLSASGELDVEKTATPNERAKAFKRQLSLARTRELFMLASQSSDFAVACDQVADGTSAAMRVTYEGIEKTYSCNGSAQWPVGTITTKLLATINRYVPKDMQVF